MSKMVILSFTGERSEATWVDGCISVKKNTNEAPKWQELMQFLESDLYKLLGHSGYVLGYAPISEAKLLKKKLMKFEYIIEQLWSELNERYGVIIALVGVEEAGLALDNIEKTLQSQSFAIKRTGYFDREAFEEDCYCLLELLLPDKLSWSKTEYQLRTYGFKTFRKNFQVR